MAYGIKNKETGLYFGGFDKAQALIWSNEPKWSGSRIAAQAQASLLICHGHMAQRKPVAL